MERKQLRETFSTVNAGDQLTVNYGTGVKTEYTVKQRRVWKGKGGSILLECVSPDGTTANIGTFSADSIVNVSVNGGNEVGLPTGTSLPKIFKSDSNKSVALKTQFLALKGKKNVEVTVESATEPSIVGTFRVDNVRKTPGRCGPVVLDLTNVSTGEKSVLSAVRHSGVIDRVLVISSTEEEEEQQEVDEDSSI